MKQITVSVSTSLFNTFESQVSTDKAFFSAEGKKKNILYLCISSRQGQSSDL